MSSSIRLFGNTLIYPKLNFLILTKDGERICFRSYFFEWYFFSSFLVGLYYSFKVLRRIPALIKDFYFKYKPFKINPTNLAVIFGFGDSLASVKVTKVLLSLGFDLILINKKELLGHRTKYSMNKNELIEEVDVKNICVSYEEILENNEIIKEKIGSKKINFVFDFTSFRITIDTDKITKENEELQKNKLYKFLDENEEAEKQEEMINDKNAKTGNESFGKTNLQKKQNQNALEYYNSKIFYSEEIGKHIKDIIFISEYLVTFMQSAKIIIFDYKDKEKDINHKLTVDFKKIFFYRLKFLANKNKIFTIKNVKNINGLINYKFKQFTEEDVIKILRYSDSRSSELSFI